MQHPVAIALARALNAAFFFLTCAYCLLAYSPFAYQQFLKPAVISWVPDFLAIHTASFWLALLVTSLTVRLKPDATPEIRLKPDATPEIRLKPHATLETWLKPDATPEGRLKQDAAPEIRLKPDATPEIRLKPHATLETWLKPGATPEGRLKQDAAPEIRLKPHATLETWLKPDATPEVRLKQDAAPEGRLMPNAMYKSYVASAYRRTSALWLGRAYLGIGALVGIALILRPVMPSIGNTRRSFVIGLLALVPPVWLAICDHLHTKPAGFEPSDRLHVLKTCALAAVCIWAVYAIGAPMRLRRVIGVELSTSALLPALAASAAAHLFVFMALFLILAGIGGLARLSRASGHVEYWLLGAGVASSVALVTYGLAFTSIAFVGLDAALAAVAIGTALALVWSGVAHRRVGATCVSPLQMWLSPISGVGHRGMAAAALVCLPVAAYGLVSATSGLDWNFLIQKLGVLAVWLIAFTCVHSLLGRPASRPSGFLMAGPPFLVLVLFQATQPFAAGSQVVDRYAAVDMSFRLIRDLRVAHEGETAAFYTWLKANTLVSPTRVRPADVQFVGERRPATGPPDIFLFVIDSLRRDYVSAYNASVAFTPAIGAFAADSFVFERAFTRYAGTGLAVPSIWAGGMLIHMLEQRPFDTRNALLTLLETDRYRRVMGIDHIMRDLLPADPDGVELDRGVPPMECDFCRTMRELEAELDRSSEDARPIFSYTLPQNVHIAVASKRRVPADRSYPGFFAPVAESVRQVDACFGEFIAFLKRSHRYDDSIVIVTSDHGDSLGEEGRWGHAYFMVPEVMRIPLIMHVPSALRGRAQSDLNRVAFSTDITPTLYALLGHNPRDLGPLFGAPLVVPRDREMVSRRRGSFLLASSYGAVYGMLTHNGRMLYTADALDGREDAFDVSGATGRRIARTETMSALNRRLMTEQLGQLAALNHFTPQP